MLHPLSRTQEATRLFGWLFMSGAGLLLFYALQSRASGQFSLKLLISAIHLLTGFLLLVNPLEDTVGEFSQVLQNAEPEGIELSFKGA